MTMQMLTAAGLSAPGEPPGYEDQRIFLDVGEAGWWNNYHAVKFVDPHSGITWFSLNRFPRVIVCRRRDVREQAKSISKFLALVSGIPSAPHRIFRADIAKAQRWYDRQRRRADVLDLVFEDTLREPMKAAERIVKFVGDGEPKKVASVVRDREPGCYQGLLEMTL